jgi:Zn-dependent protease with chaperone function
MSGVRVSRLLVAILAFSCLAALLDWASTTVGASAGQREMASTLLMGLVIACYPVIAPTLLPLMVRRSLSDSPQVARLHLALDQILPAGIRRLIALAVGTKGTSAFIIAERLAGELDDAGLRSVLAHELGHLNGGHNAQATLFLAGLFVIKAFTALPFLVVFCIFLGYLAMLRRHELQADAFAASLVGRDAMQALLMRLATLVSESVEQPNPFVGALKTIFSTHPSFRDRAEALPGGAAS